MIFLIGIKGAGMAALACMLHDIGESVSGSDIEKHIFTEDELHRRNIPVYPFLVHEIMNHSTVVIGNAFLEDFEEVKRARANKTLKIFRYHEFLGKLMENYRTIAIAGSHGKTTTTNMVSTMMGQFFNTGHLIGDGDGMLGKNDRYLIAEACEYRRHFLAYRPQIAVITNVDIDHVDYFKDEADYASAYEQFSENVSEVCIVFGDDPRSRNLKLSSSVLFYGIEQGNDVLAENIVETPTSTAFDVIILGKYFGRFELPFVGTHMLYNSLAAITIGYCEGLTAQQCNEGLALFKGAKRRFVITSLKDSVFIDDYAHHPTEVSVTVDAARKRYPDKTLVVIFKPHRVSRVLRFAKEFADALSKADVVALCPFTSIDDKEEGIDIDITYLQKMIEGSFIVDENEQDAMRLAAYKPAVYLFMSSKDIYNLSDLVKRYQ
jgi:UDP-N-acetylmuramate--alanine ligase